MIFARRHVNGLWNSLTLSAVAVGTLAAVGLTNEAGIAAPLPSIDPAMSSASLALDRAELDRNLARGATVETAEAAPVNAQELECMAKVVLHEAGGQTREGQLAVAQLMVARTEKEAFAPTICGVAAQRGQFFDVESYNPRQDKAWETAVAVSIEALNGSSGKVAPGALFYHSSASKPTAFFRTRQRIASIGGNTFYR